jgi:hypothetical protein
MALSDPTQLQLVDQLLDNLESEEPADTLAFIAKNTKAPMMGQGEKKDPLACFSMAIEGSCKRENCTYSHEPAVTENGSRNIPNTMCGLVGTFLISHRFLVLTLFLPQNVRFLTLFFSLIERTR